MRQDEKLLKELQGSFKRQVDEFREKRMHVFKAVEPSIEAKKAMMKAARTPNADNVFFISIFDGSIVTSLWCDKNSYVSNPPRDSYQVSVVRNHFLSYKELDEIIQDALCISNMEIEEDIKNKLALAKYYTFVVQIMEELDCSESQALEIKEGLDMVERSTYSNEILKYNFGYSEDGIRELRKDAVRFRV